ncbi:MAG TPA: ATP-binding cassette domain-containing protein [Halanaerobiales bacterium]|nr:ATP-binding cassette domain-containing protein [Halanaerobiales bacterium]
MSEYVMNINNIEKSFQNTKAVDKVSFEVKKGEVLGLLGPNGAGKTTIIRMIMDIFQPDTGEIKLNRDLIPDQKKIGYLPEERGIYDSTKVLDTILYFADLKGMNKKEAKSEALRWLELFDLEEYKNNKIEDLSRGMQQKVQFIISVIHKPKLLILDEVFSGLDPVNQELFKEIISNLTKDGTTILLSSHRMNLVEEVCSRIFMINKGKRVLYGNIDEIKDGYNEKKVILKSKSDVGFIKNIVNVSDIKIENNEVTFNIKNDVNIKEFLSFLSKKIDVDEISIVKPPLHEIFVNAAKGGNNIEG